jgi:hypothetical protein
MKPNHNVMVGTPAYNGMVHTSFTHSLLSFKNTRVNFGLISIDGESLITRARNTILAHFYHSPQYTHLLFLDGDVHLDGADVLKMLASDKDVIGAPVPLKTTEKEKPVFNIHGNLGQEDGLVKVEWLGTAVMMLSRNAANALVQDAIDHDQTYQPNPYARGVGDAETVYDVFQVGVKNGIYLSEDYWVCNKLIGLNFDIYVDLTIKTRHSGMTSFSY